MEKNIYFLTLKPGVGAERVLEANLTSEEKALFNESVEHVKKLILEIKL